MPDPSSGPPSLARSSMRLSFSTTCPHQYNHTGRPGVAGLSPIVHQFDMTCEQLSADAFSWIEQAGQVTENEIFDPATRALAYGQNAGDLFAEQCT